jgi:hypothetical protein
MEIFNYLKKRDKIDIFIKTTGRPGNMKKNGTVPFKTVRMVSLVEVQALFWERAFIRFEYSLYLLTKFHAYDFAS